MKTMLIGAAVVALTTFGFAGTALAGGEEVDTGGAGGGASNCSGGNNQGDVANIPIVNALNGTPVLSNCSGSGGNGGAAY
jgi:hypothetical protein